VSDTYTVDYRIDPETEMPSATGNWSIDRAVVSTITPRVLRTNQFPRLFGIALLATAVSSASAFADPWKNLGQHRSQLTATTAFRAHTRRRLTPAEARDLALDILRRAESGRDKYAELEARRGDLWEESA
jgi:hypothetical protein